MTWQRFEYICRRTFARIEEGETVSVSLAKAKNETGADLYGDIISPKSLQHQILSDIEKLDDDKAILALNIYKNLQMNQQLDKSLKFKRVFTYLMYVSIFFYMVAAIYHLKVIPTFSEFFTDLEWGMPSFFVFYDNYGGLFLLLVLALLLLSLSIYLKLLNLIDFREGNENSFLFRYLILPSIKTSYIRVKTILTFPVQALQTNSDIAVTEHLNNISRSTMDVGYELKVLAEVEMSRLLSECQWQIKIMTIMLFSTMVFSIFSFLFAAYTPLFYMGEAI